MKVFRNFDKNSFLSQKRDATQKLEENWKYGHWPEARRIEDLNYYPGI